MSPEQAQAKELDARTDLFSFGTVLYEMTTGQMPFRGNNTTIIFDAILNRTPVAAAQLNPKVPIQLERVINKCLEKDRNLRYKNASEIKADLVRLQKRTESTVRSGLHQRAWLYGANFSFRKWTSQLKWILVGIATLLVIMLLVAGAGWLKHRVKTVQTGNLTIAVLPLVNINNDSETEFLQFALADEIANALTYTHSLEIRPSRSTQKYVNGEANPAKAGRELGVGTVVAGHFVRQDKNLMVTLEAVEVKDNRLIWTGTLTSTTDNLIALQNQIAKKVRQELVPALGISGGTVEPGSAPVNREGYNAYLRTLAMSHDAAANKDAIAMLERAVKLDPNYAPVSFFFIE